MSEKRKEVKMSKSVTVNVSADELWQIIGPGFAKAGEWSSAIDHSTSSGEGQFEGAVCDTRSCDLSAKGFSSVDERITEYSDDNRTMAFDVYQGMPGFVTHMNSRHVITDLGQGRSKDEIQITMQMKPFMGALMGGMLKKNLNSLLDSALEDLKVFAETGKPSAEKAARMKKLSAKAA
ncbi:MAG: SRPBCC family protein [Crocinitomicaceae bacterium]|nr:SRPBCC family protein [Crocinitomicaceae bacterium]